RIISEPPPIKPRGVSWVTAPTVHVRLGVASSPVWGADQPDIWVAVIVSPGFRLNRSKSYSLPPWRRVVWLSRIPSGVDGEWKKYLFNTHQLARARTRRQAAPRTT